MLYTSELRVYVVHSEEVISSSGYIPTYEFVKPHIRHQRLKAPKTAIVMKIQHWLKAKKAFEFQADSDF